MESALNTASIAEGIGISLDEVVIRVLAEVQARARAAGAGYPFSLNGTVLRTSDWKTRPTYVFCLLLSYYSWKPKQWNCRPAQLFEELCTGAAQLFVGGKAVRFGFPRADVTLHSTFRTAVDRLCNTHLGEGKGYSGEKALSSKDDGLDIVAWKDHADGRSGKIVLFGACAAGHDWDQKVHELNPVSFCHQWMQKTPPSHIVKMFFLPHRIEPDRWDKLTRDAGIVFDRCRIAACSPTLPGPSTFGDPMAWCEKALTDLGA